MTWRYVPAVAVLLLAIAARPIAPHDPSEIHGEHTLESPTLQFPLGTDPLGRCVLSQALYATSTSFGLALLATVLSAAAGLIVGLAGGYFGSWGDLGFRVLSNVGLALPTLVVTLAVVAILGPGWVNLLLALSLSAWVRYAMVARDITRAQMSLGFVVASRALGASDWWILRRHILPEVVRPTLILAALGLGSSMLSISAISFLGLGISPPIFEWGTMLNSARPYLNTTPRLLAIPGIAIVLTVGAFTLLAEELRERGTLFSRYSRAQ